MIAWLGRVPRSEATAALLSLGVGIALLIIKFIAYFLTGSAAIFSDALESIVNVAAASVALYALVVAHSPVDQLGAGIILIAAAMVINGGVGFALIRVGRRQGSMTLEADGHHLMSDAITSATALGALAVVKLLRWPLADPIAALLIAGYIGWMGILLLRRSSAGLMDRQDAADDQLLQQILDSHIGPRGKPPQICSYHKVRHRHSGRYHWVDFHIMVPPKLNVELGHAVASAIEYEIEQALGEGNATAHIEPCLEVPCEL